jgi:diadenosine tetraphosphate (Ap4A) HIT family hydrolase
MHRISREQAEQEWLTQRGEQVCLICALRERAAAEGLLLRRTAHTTAVLTRYPLRWGHVLVLTNAHVTTFDEVALEVWREASEQALLAARALERATGALRCYVASFGSTVGELPLSSPHLHVHVIPIHDPADKPSTVIGWQNGVYAGGADEWAALSAMLLAAWDSVAAAAT